MSGGKFCVLSPSDFEASFKQLSQYAAGGECPHVASYKLPYFGVEVIVVVGTPCSFFSDCGKSGGGERKVTVGAGPIGKRKLVDTVIVQAELRSFDERVLTFSGQVTTSLPPVVVAPGRFQCDAQSVEFICAADVDWTSFEVVLKVSVDNGDERGERSWRKVLRLNGGRTIGAAPNARLDVLRGLGKFSLKDFVVLGDYRRGNPEVRSRLVDLRGSLEAVVAAPESRVAVSVLWGAPGSGKSFFVEEFERLTVKPLVEKHEWRYETLNFVRVSSPNELTEFAERVFQSPLPCFVFLDEVDSEKAPLESAEFLMRMFKGEEAKGKLVVCVAGSSGVDLPAMIARMIARNAKFADAFDRVPAVGRHVIPGLDEFDAWVVFVSAAVTSAKRLGKRLEFMDKACLVYLIHERSRFPSVRQLSFLADAAVARVNGAVLRLVNLASDDESARLFMWFAQHSDCQEFSGTYLTIDA